MRRKKKGAAEPATTPKKDKVVRSVRAKPGEKVLQVIAIREGFRRGGMSHSGIKEYSANAFTRAELADLFAENEKPDPGIRVQWIIKPEEEGA